MQRALFIASFDSQLKWCRNIREEFERQGFLCRTVVPGVRSALSEEQIRAAGFDSVEKASWEETVALAQAHDVVVTSLSGPMTRRLAFELSVSELPGPRPVLVSGWVGIIIEKLTAGYLDRMGCDVVAVNSKEDLARFISTAETLNVPSNNLVLTGLPFLPQARAPMRGGPIRKVLFADQPTVPENREERIFVWDQMIKYAQRHPDREVILKPRHRPDEDTFHKMKFAPEQMLEGRAFPPNFRIDYTPISEIIAEIDLLVTMSSTASLEALAVGTRVAYPLDLGIHERYGNHIFQNTGLLRTFAQIADDDIGTPSDTFIDSYFFEKDLPSFELIVARCTELLAQGERPVAAIWDSAFYKSMRAGHFDVMELREEYRRQRALGKVKGQSSLSRLSAVLRMILPEQVFMQVYRAAKSANLVR